MAIVHIKGTVLVDPINNIVDRSLRVSGRLDGFGWGQPDASASATVTFISGGSEVGSFGITISGADWSWQGLVPNAIQAGQAFSIRIDAEGRFGPDTFLFIVTGSTPNIDLTLREVLPELTIISQSPVTALSLPHSYRLAGIAKEGTSPPYRIQQVQYQIGNGPLANANPDTPDWSQWSALLSLPAGETLITVRASDPFGAATTRQWSVTVFSFSMPAVIDPHAEKTLVGVPTTSSITTWTRLEPRCSNADMSATTGARLFDPLWLMTRQWQMGEFQGEDTGSPVQAHVRATSATLTRCYFGELSQHSTAPGYNLAHGPLETLVERRTMRPASRNDPRMLTLAVDAGLHFLRMLELNETAKNYRSAFLTKYGMQPLPAQTATVVDDATARFVQTMVGRAPDARLLRSALRRVGTPAFTFDPTLQIAPTDVPAVTQVAVAWLAWYDGLFAEPAGPKEDAWVPPRLEYAVSVATRLSAQPQDGITLSASEFDGGRLDWSSFDVNNTFSIDTTGDQTFVALNETTVPAPVTFRGAPAARFWELEDAQVAFGLVAAGPPDLAHLLMIEYASSYGNDWYVVPLTVPVGSVTRVDSLVVTDTFGVRSLLRPIGDPALAKPYFSMWQLALRRYAGNEIQAPVTNVFFLPPTLGRSINGGLLEDVVFMRDEMANIAWAIEGSVEGGIEMPVQLAAGLTAAAAPPSSTTPAAPDALPRYLLATSVPANWIPLLPVELDQDGHGNLVSWLKRGAVLQPDGSGKVHTAQSEALNSLSSGLVYDEEVPREGVHIMRRRRMTRWLDGSMWVWTAFRNDVGRGEGSAGLCFDQLLGPDGNPQ